MKFLFTIGFLTVSLAAFAQVPATTPPAAGTPTAKPAAPAKVLTPAEIRQREKVAKVLEEERRYREDIAKAQREYQAKQAEKERQRREKEQQRQAKETAPASAALTQPAPVDEPAKTARPEKAAKPPKSERIAKTPATPADSSATNQPAEPKPERNRRQRTAETAAPEPKQSERGPTERDISRQQQQVERDLARQKQQAERDARKVERAKDRILQPATTDAADPASAPEGITLPAKEFLPKGHLFAPIMLDPLEAQTYVSVLPAFRTDGRNYPGTIVPFTFGFCKPFFRWTKAPGRASELSLDVASYTQFEVYYDDALKTQKRQIINTDYKFSVIYNLLRNNHAWRFRFYHLSSHLGDDYLFRNSIQYYTPNAVNYELVDATYSQTINATRLYGGIGIGLRKPEERKLLSAHAGFFYRSPQRNHFARLVGGVDLKVWQQTDFRPGIKAAIGVDLGKVANPVTFVLEGYTGFRPYSEYENQHVRWLGIGFYFNPI